MGGVCKSPLLQKILSGGFATPTLAGEFLPFHPAFWNQFWVFCRDFPRAAVFSDHHGNPEGRIQKGSRYFLCSHPHRWPHHYSGVFSPAFPVQRRLFFSVSERHFLCRGIVSSLSNRRDSVFSHRTPRFPGNPGDRSTVSAQGNHGKFPESPPVSILVHHWHTGHDENRFNHLPYCVCLCFFYHYYCG